MTVAQERATAGDVVWLYGRSETSNEKVVVADKEVTGYVTDVSLGYDAIVSPATEDANHRQNPSSDERRGVLGATLRLPTDVTRYVTAVVVTGLDPSRRSARIRVCSIGSCAAAAESSVSQDGRDVWFTLSRALGARDAVAIKLQGADLSGQPFGIRLAISTERGTRVYHDGVADVFEMPHPASYFSAPDCALVPQTRERVVADCRSVSRLTRRELYVPGWSATRNDKAIEVRPTSTIYQSVVLPAGESSIEFSFEPPLMQYGYAAFVLAVLVLGYQTFAYVRNAQTHVS